MADRYRGTIYVGVTADIAARAVQHREGKGGSFTHRYGLTRLVYLERYDDITDAIAREKAVKKWNRAWKIRAIEEQNSECHDRFDTLNRSQERAPRLRGDDEGLERWISTSTSTAGPRTWSGMR